MHLRYSPHILLLLFCTVCCDSRDLINNEKSEAENQQNGSYDPELLLSKIFGLQNDTHSRQNGGYGLVSNLGTGNIHFPEETQDYYSTDLNNQQFENNYQNPQKRPGKRRKKPRYNSQYAGQYGYNNYGFNQQLQPEFLGQNEFQTNGVYRPEFGSGLRPGIDGVRPASLTANALSSLTEALNSIARNDDYQCVPRLLCEVAAGQRPGQSSEGSIFSSLLNIQPLITLLSAYNGMSSSPIFTFGRAALLGLTSQGNTASCIYAYPQCPRDTDQLINYLNNHNGGFFRFFNGLNQQANQLGYPQLSDQTNGPLSNLIQNTLAVSNLNQGQFQNQNGYLQNNLQLQNLQNSNRYPNFNSINHGQSFYNQLNQNLGSPNSNHGSQNQKVRFRRERKRKLFDNNRLQDRIQNYYSNNQGSDNAPFIFKSGSLEAEEDKNNLRFPDDPNSVFLNDDNIQNDGTVNDQSSFDGNKNVRFPDNLVHYGESPEVSVSNRRRPKRIKFPLDSEYGLSESHDTYQSVFQTEDDGTRYQSSSEFNKMYEKLKAEFIANFESSNLGPSYSDEDNNEEVVYVVRGNGDPNHPEIVKFRS